MNPITDLLDSGDFAAAAALLKAALQANPEDPVALLGLAKLSCLIGQFREAERTLIKALQNGAEAVESSRLLAALLHHRKQHAAALPFAEIALECPRNQPAVQQLLSEILAALGQTERAQSHLTLASVCEPAEARAGVTAFEENRLAQAISLLQRALHSTPASIISPGPCAAALQRSGDLASACKVLRRAIQVRPTAEILFIQLGDLLNRIPDPSAATACFRAALELNPENASAHLRLGTTQIDLEQTQDGINHLLAASTLRPDWPTPLRFLAGGLMQVGEHEQAIRALQHSLELSPQDPVVHSQLLQALNYLQIRNPEAHFAQFQQFAQRFETPVTSSRIRVGYVSADFRNHSIAFFVEPLLRSHDRSRFEIFCYSNHPNQDAVTHRLRGHADQWREIHSLDDQALAQLIQSDRIDILVDCSNHTSGNRLPAFAYRPAPVQITMLGLMQTTGLQSMGYRITDPFLDPDDSDKAYHTEQRVRLQSGAFVFSPPTEAPAVAASPVSRGRPFTFGCTNELIKVTNEVAQTWIQILQAAPQSRFLFFGRAGNTLTKTLLEAGIAPERITEMPRQSMPAYLAAHAELDLCLDPFPYNGLTVTLLSCWMGVPCVTLAGNTPPARAAAAILQRLGLPEFVTSTKEDYIAQAVTLATHPEPLLSLRPRLRERVAHHFTRAEVFVPELEGTYARLLQSARRHPPLTDTH
ncbi:MAG: hypothetical protein RLZZ399_100 [Verrucomicrobiota bacterium]|jgi:predicted O-linked N-acetylglucosamine transferase (SPINDLY family)